MRTREERKIGLHRIINNPGSRSYLAVMTARQDSVEEDGGCPAKQLFVKFVTLVCVSLQSTRSIR